MEQTKMTDKEKLQNKLDPPDCTNCLQPFYRCRNRKLDDKPICSEWIRQINIGIDLTKHKKCDMI